MTSACLQRVASSCCRLSNCTVPRTNASADSRPGPAAAVFRLGQGEAVYSAAAAPAPSYPGTERRGPNRAKNVTRPSFGAKAKAKVKAPKPTAEAVPAKNGTDGDWTSF